MRNIKINNIIKPIIIPIFNGVKKLVEDIELEEG